jgi:tyrosyl-tRNA synthetase
VTSELASTRSEGRRAIEQGGVSVDGEKITDVKYLVSADQLSGEGIMVRRGKKKFKKVCLQ